MGKHGPCRHCGVTSTPLWRNGPPEKPVLCNACGSRWRTKGSLANYTPLHAREPFEWEEPKVAKAKSISFKNTEQKLQKRKRMNCIVENACEIPFSESGQNYIRPFEGDASNRSSSGSAISCSESCANFGAVDTCDWTGSAQSNAWESLLPAPSKKRSFIKIKPSPVEKLTKDLYSIWHEQQSSNLSGSLEEELLFESERPMGSVEIGHGGVLLRYPSSNAAEEESEASSFPVDNMIAGPFTRSASILAESERKRIILPNAHIDKFNKFTVHEAVENERDRFSPDSIDMLQNRESTLRFTDLKEVINLDVFMEHMKNEEQLLLMKFLPCIDTDNLPESLGSMFSSPQFLENLSYYQQLLQNGIFDLSSSLMNAEECRNLKSLVLLNFTKSRWVNHYKEQKDKKQKQSAAVNKGESRKNFFRHSNIKRIKRPHESERLPLKESKDAMRSPKRVFRSVGTKFFLTKSSALLPNDSESEELIGAESFLDGEGTCFSPRSLFASPPDRSSMLQFTDDSTDQGVLLDDNSGGSLPEAGLLLRRPLNQKTVSNSSVAENSAAAEDESLCNFTACSFSGQELN